ncbi:MAG TPA: glutaredoxin domain-containing protein [Burkholderiales bacterium]|nr:glutaredoxin domain-containing protein [Burkholderiales bacterium]
MTIHFDDSGDAMPTERIKVFWQPGCTSCLRTKEFLARQGVDFESINVHGDEAAMAELRSLGARSVPVVARGGRFVYAQTLQDVVRFLDLQIRLAERLPPQSLVEKLDVVLSAAVRYVRQLPEARLALPFRNRNRPIRVLAHHVFRIPEAFLEVVPAGPLDYDRIMKEPGADLCTGEDIACYGDSVRVRFLQWWRGYPDKECATEMETYFGRHSLHEVLERTVWHPAQHVRQLLLILEELGIEPDGPITMRDLSGLPLPEKAWDGEAS